MNGLPSNLIFFITVSSIDDNISIPTQYIDNAINTDSIH